jgi:hypothetical protein
LVSPPLSDRAPPNAGKFAFKFLSAVRLTRAAAVDTFRP